MSTQGPIEAMARAIHQERQFAGFGGKATWEYEPADIRALHLQTARAALAAFRAWLADEGLVVVPKSPSKDQFRAGSAFRLAVERHGRKETEGIYEAMIAAAPDTLGETKC
jgi:hypothetical protein